MSCGVGPEDDGDDGLAPVVGESSHHMRTSTVSILAGIVLFLLPFPPTSTIGALVVVADARYRLLAE